MEQKKNSSYQAPALCVIALPESAVVATSEGAGGIPLPDVNWPDD